MICKDFTHNHLPLYRMRIKRIEIENFKGITSLSVDFSGRLNAFVGANGAGKSTVLEAVNILLSWVEARVRNEKGVGTSIQESQIHVGAEYARLTIDVELEDRSYRWSLYRKSSRVRRKLDNDTSNLTESRECANHILRLLEVGHSAVPVITSFGVNRAVDEIPKFVSSRKHKLDPIDVFEKDSQVSFRSLFEWMLERQNIENEDYRIRREKGEPFSEDRELAAVKRAIEETFDHTYTDLRVRSNPRRVTIEKSIDGTGHELELSQLSDGEKCYLAIVASIARLLAMASTGRHDALDGPGIVLIDEIDLHLHPEWQLRIVPRLLEVFRGCQFVISTHSPHVVSSIPDGKGFTLVSMEDGKGVVVNESWYGKESDDILLTYFGLPHVRNNEIHRLLEKVWKHLNEGTTGTKEYLADRRSLQEALGPNDPALLDIMLQEALNAKRRSHEANN